jgi:hypothetical protein
VSFDDGVHWQSLRLNMPATSVRALTIKDDDLVAATDGRGLWILDDISPLRHITPDVAAAPAYLFRPAAAWRFRQASPGAAADEPSAANPPDGVAITYLLGPDVSGPIALEIVQTTTGTLLRRYSSDAARPSDRLAATPGLHRLFWDVRFAPPAADAFAASPAGVLSHGPWVQPGTYQVRLTAGGRALRQAVIVKLDPRVRTSLADLTLQFELSRALGDVIAELALARSAVSERLAGASAGVEGGLRSAAAALDQAYQPLPALFRRLQAADAKPTAATEAATREAMARARATLAQLGTGDAGSGALGQ